MVPRRANRTIRAAACLLIAFNDVEVLYCDAFQQCHIPTTQLRRAIVRHQHSRIQNKNDLQTWSLRMDSSNKSSTSNNNKKKTQGVYVRPSGAIERGSGFFVPGLEGPRVRLVFGSVLVFLTALNHVLVASSVDDDFTFQELLAISYSLLILLQSAIEYVKEQRLLEAERAAITPDSSMAIDKPQQAGSSSTVLKQDWDATAKPTDTFCSKIQWTAASYLSMTPSTEIMLLSADTAEENTTIMYRLGRRSSLGSSTGDAVASGVKAALEEVKKSKGGRISIPLTHPAVKTLVSNEAAPIRTVILQRISEDQCWMVTSDQLLASYTSGDLKWLGQLAKYVAT